MAERLITVAVSSLTTPVLGIPQVIRFKKSNEGVGKRDPLNDIATISTASLLGQSAAQIPSFERRSGGAVTYRMPNF